MVEKKESKKSDKNDSGLAPKFLKHIPDGFPEKCSAADDNELKKMLVEAEQIISQYEKDLSNDDEINGLKQLLKDKTMDYKEVIIEKNSCVKFIIWVLESRGKI